jgi:hypothetical protein
MGRRGEESEDEDLEPEDEDDMDFDDDDFDDENEDLDDENEEKRGRSASKSPVRRVAARRLIEQAREQRDLHRSLAEFDDYLK